MTYKCEYKLRCVEWEQDSLQCCIFYQFCRGYKQFKEEEKQHQKAIHQSKVRRLENDIR
jgi:hypothetical protein